jgi:hypothetical protein
VSSLDRLPAFATCGVGSLPFPSARTAARHAVRAYDVPFCPQLPRLDGDMIHEWLGDDPGRCGWSSDRDRQLPAAWDHFVHELREDPPEHRLAKLQITGPVTLAAALERSAGRPGHGGASLAHEIAVWLAANVAEQIAGLGDVGMDVLLIVDEPGLAASGMSDMRIWDPLRIATWGIHVCGVVPWRLVRELEPDVLSYDVVRYGVGPEVRELIARGTRIAWGVLDPVQLVLASGFPPDRCLLTPTCGTGRLSVGRELIVAATLADLGSSLRGDADLAVELGRDDRSRASRGAERVLRLPADR